MKNFLKTNSINSFNTKYLSSLPGFKNEKNKQYLAITLTLSATMFFALFAINPTLSTISKLKKEIEDNNLVEQRLSQKISNLSTLSQEYVSVKEDVPFITDAVPEKPEVTQLTAQIQSVANSSNVLIKDLKISPLELNNVATSQGRLEFSLSASGAFDSLTSFLSSLTKMQRAIEIESITLGQGSEQSDISLKGGAYFKK